MENKGLVLFTISIISLVLVLTQLQVIINKYNINADTQSMFTVHHFPEGLKNNLFVQYFATKTGSKIPLINIYAFINRFTDFILFTKLFGIALFLISIYYIYKLGELLQDKKYALILTSLFSLHAWLQFPLAGGISKAFAVPFIIAFLYYLIKKQQLMLSITLLILATFYPPIWLVAIGTYIFSRINIKERKINFKLNENWIFYISVFISIIIILLTMFFLNYGFDNPITFQEALHSPDFYLGGRIVFFKAAEPVISRPIDILNTILATYNIGIKTPLITDPVLMLIILTSIMFFLFRKKMSMPKEIYLLAISSFFLQFVASMVLFNLYFPNRYVFITIPLFLIIISSQGLYFLSNQKNKQWVFFMLLLLLTIFYIPQIYNPGKSNCPDKELYLFLEELPKGTTFAAHPKDADCIAVYSGKMPFLTEETAVPFDKNYYNIVKNRTFDFFSAYYTQNKTELTNFCKKHNINYLIVNKEHFTENYLTKKVIYFNPFSDHIKNITYSKNNFYLLHPEDVVLTDKNKLIIKCNFPKEHFFINPFNNYT